MSGREVRGTGGGASVLGGVGLGALGSAPFVGSLAWGLFMPKERADLAGIGDGRSGDTRVVVVILDTGCVGLLGGSAGVVGGGLISTVATLDVDLVPTRGTFALSTSLYPGNAFDFSISLYLFSTSSFVRLGGSGGNEGSKTGAFTRLPSIEAVLECAVFAVPFEKADMEEMFEKVEEIDSLEAFLFICRFSDGLLGGNAGEGCVDFFLAGSLGGGAGAGFAGCETT